jgi:anti-sigma B factor antagonist
MTLMEISIIEYKHCSMLKATGRVDSSTAPILGDAMNKIMDSGVFKIVFDMSELEYISSSGLRVIINTQKNCKRYNRGELVLASVPLKIYSALDLAGFLPFFKIIDDVTAAVGQF